MSPSSSNANTAADVVVVVVVEAKEEDLLCFFSREELEEEEEKDGAWIAGNADIVNARVLFGTFFKPDFTFDPLRGRLLVEVDELLFPPPRPSPRPLPRLVPLDFLKISARFIWRARFS
jgi:hypothetical protein